MLTASTGTYSYQVDVSQFSYVKEDFYFLLGEMVDLAVRAGIHQKDFTRYSQALSEATKRFSDFDKAVDEAIGVLNDERQAALYCLLSELMNAAYITGACQVLSGLDPVVRELTAERAKRARAARTSPEREAAINAAIESHGPKVVNIQKHLRRLGIDIGDDAIRRRQKKTRPLDRSGSKMTRLDRRDLARS